MSAQINDFLQAFSNDSRFCLSFPFLWTVSIDGVYTSDINVILGEAGESWEAKLTPNSMTKNGNILPAQQVVIPIENSDFTPMKMGDSMGGFLPPMMLNSRADFLSRTVSINFLETTRDLEHEFFRPWMIALGIKGLTEYAGSNLKATITVKQYKNDGTFRKGYQFFKAFPISVEGFTMDYENTDFPMKSVMFACQNYKQL